MASPRRGPGGRWAKGFAPSGARRRGFAHKPAKYPLSLPVTGRNLRETLAKLKALAPKGRGTLRFCAQGRRYKNAAQGEPRGPLAQGLTGPKGRPYYLGILRR
ncbi:hypothetical protein YIM730264_14220 [Thermus hydrothermalis]